MAVVVVLLTSINETQTPLVDHFIDWLAQNQSRTTVQSRKQLFKQATYVETRIIKNTNFS